MFKSLSALTLLAVAAVQQAAGQIATDSAVATGLASTMLNLQGAHVIPDLLPASNFNLAALLMQTFGSMSTSVGQSLSIAEVANQPTFSLQYTSSAASKISNQSFTIMTLDPGAATATPGNVVAHFLANNVTLHNGQLFNTTQAITGWYSPAPPPGSGTHRYTTLVFSQGADFNLPDSLAHRMATINTNFNLGQYISQTKLGPVVAATFFQCQNSTAATTSVAPVATSSVSPSQISSAASSASASLAAAYGQSTSNSFGGASGVASSFSVHYAGILAAGAFAGALVLL